MGRAYIRPRHISLAHAALPLFGGNRSLCCGSIHVVRCSDGVVVGRSRCDASTVVISVGCTSTAVNAVGVEVWAVVATIAVIDDQCQLQN